MSEKSVSISRELWIARLCIAATLLCAAGMLHFVGVRLYDAYIHHKNSLLTEDVVFALAMAFMVYGSLLYQICVVGYYQRKKDHIPAERSIIDSLYTAKAPALSVLIPSYKEEKTVILQTLLSVALAEYPRKNVVLLIDDPYHSKSQEDLLKLEETRVIPEELNRMFAPMYAHFATEYEAFLQRKNTGTLRQPIELNRISLLYDTAAEWIENLSREIAGQRMLDSLSHTERFFIQHILDTPIKQHKQLARDLRRKMTLGGALDVAFLERHYARLTGLFNVYFSSFERKKYANLSHEANKAMNLNSYIALIGKSWKEVETKYGLELHEAAPEEAHFRIPAADYVNTIDADSLMLSNYLIRMVEMMQRPENDRLAVIQSSVSSIPHSLNTLEHTTGICLDLQFMNHQGFTHWDATFWVGANALLRHRALEEIKETKEHNGKNVTVYIQDRTVIEDTESTVDLIDKGWKLYNYPERLSYSTMPADFGSLLIQRRRWANGGMIILPKLFRYMARAPKNLKLFKEFFMRFHYLAATTLSCVVITVLSLYHFGDDLATMWIMLSAIPASILYLRTLMVSGCSAFDIFRVFSLNMMLMPVIFGGVIKQFEQMITGKKIPFGRTPKVVGRTAAPAVYYMVEFLMAGGFLYVCSHDIAAHHWFHALFTAMNSAFMLYAVTFFVGVNAAFEDIASECSMHWNAASARTQTLASAATGKLRTALLPLAGRFIS